MVQFSWYRPLHYYGTGSYDITRKGLPHSEIPGSKSVCDSPRLIAAYYVLHRLLEPSHPPKALCSLTTKIVVTLFTTLFMLLCSTISPHQFEISNANVKLARKCISIYIVKELNATCRSKISKRYCYKKLPKVVLQLL